MITVYRIIQEALSNIAKHAQASQAVITLLFSDTAVSITIKDNGKAERLPSVAGPGIGLLGIRERVTALDGKFSMTIAEPQGLILDVWLPLTATVSAE